MIEVLKGFNRDLEEVGMGEELFITALRFELYGVNGMVDNRINKIQAMT